MAISDATLTTRFSETNISHTHTPRLTAPSLSGRTLEQFQLKMFSSSSVFCETPPFLYY